MCLKKFQVFVHKSRFEGGPEGPHAQAGLYSVVRHIGSFVSDLLLLQAVSEGSVVTYEVITSQVDGKPTACNVQVGLNRAMNVVWAQTCFSRVQPSVIHY